jgi:hypothetical protein
MTVGMPQHSTDNQKSALARAFAHKHDIVKTNKDVSWRKHNEKCYSAGSGQRTRKKDANPVAR